MNLNIFSKEPSLYLWKWIFVAFLFEWCRNIMEIFSYRYVVWLVIGVRIIHWQNYAPFWDTLVRSFQGQVENLFS